MFLKMRSNLRYFYQYLETREQWWMGSTDSFTFNCIGLLLRAQAEYNFVHDLHKKFKLELYLQGASLKLIHSCHTQTQSKKH